MRKLILGGPGCGKTTRLLSIMEHYLSIGVPPERIAFVSFTRAAVHEAKGRASERFDLPLARLPYFRTLHSLAYHLLEIEPEELMTADDYGKIGAALGMEFAGQVGGGQWASGNLRDGDRVLFLWSLARARGVSLREQFNVGGHHIPWPVVQHTAATVDKYKNDLELRDYQDLIEDCRQQLDVDVAIVDECQDLTTSQWNMVDRVLARVPRVYYAGDDDQAIYQWTGADVDRFLNLDAEREVLPKSHRLPEAIWAHANAQAERIGRRYAKRWTYATKGGSVSHEPSLAAVDLSPEGSWLVLARNHYLLEYAERDMRARGILYEGAVKDQHVLGIQGWEKTRVGKELTEAQDRAMRALLPPSGAPSLEVPWMEALTQIPGSDRAYYRAIKRAGGRVTAPPRVRLATIHQVKGAEADHVVLFTDMAKRTYDDYAAMPHAEHRVWYVALTRARCSLHIVQPSARNWYQIIRA